MTLKLEFHSGYITRFSRTAQPPSRLHGLHPEVTQATIRHSLESCHYWPMTLAADHIGPHSLAGNTRQPATTQYLSTAATLPNSGRTCIHHWHPSRLNPSAFTTRDDLGTMDASSLLLSLPSSISGAVDFGQRFHYAREFQLESSDAATQLRFLTRQLDNWRRCVGITEGDELQDVHDKALDDSEILELVGDDLDSIRKHTQNLKKRLSKLGVERSPGPRASGKPGSLQLPKRDAGRPKSPIPSLKGVSWGYGRDKLVWGELDRIAQAVGHLYELVPPRASPPEDDAGKRKEGKWCYTRLFYLFPLTRCNRRS